MRSILAAAAVLVLAGGASAATLVVPSEPYPTLQSAVDASGSGDTIVLLAGTYAGNIEVTGRTNLRIVGKDGPVIDGGGGGNGLDFTNCTHVEISGVAFHGLNNGLYLTNSTGVKVTRVSLSNVNYEALGMGGCDGVVISRCTFTTVGGKGIEDSGSTGIVVDRCMFTDCAEGALSLSPINEAGSASEGARITRCVITGENSGIRAGGAGIVIDRNTFTISGWIALDLDTTARGDGAVITRNVFTMDNTDTAADLVGDGLRFQKNRVTGGGVAVRGDGGHVDRNTIGNAYFGLTVVGSGEVVTGNLVSDVDGHGLDLSGDDYAVAKNRIERCVNAGIYATVDASTFTANRIADAEFGIRIVFGGSTLAKNRVEGETVYDLWDEADVGANTYGKNSFRTQLFGAP